MFDPASAGSTASIQYPPIPHRQTANVPTTYPSTIISPAASSSVGIPFPQVPPRANFTVNPTVPLDPNIFVHMHPVSNNVIVELSALPEESIDCEVRKVYLSKVPILPDSNIPATPQSFLDTALYHLSKSSGALSTECLWLCGDLALKNFCISNGFNPKIDNSKTRIVNFLMKSFDESHPDLQLFWLVLNDCQRNAYEDYHELDVIRKHMKYVESFCNALFDIHVGNQFICEQFKKSLPESMKTKDNIFFDFY
uniref:Uncharacterized protein n=1 Tax=Acrobeloides nanus TaxID=290746 RepID=A0A914CGB8_9BILA